MPFKHHALIGIVGIVGLVAVILMIAGIPTSTVGGMAHYSELYQTGADVGFYKFTVGAGDYITTKYGLIELHNVGKTGDIILSIDGSDPIVIDAEDAYASYYGVAVYIDQANYHPNFKGRWATLMVLE